MIDANLPIDTTDDSPSVDLTPLIDVVFMLIVFLLLTANVAQVAIHVDTPESSTGQPLDQVTLVLEAPSAKGGAWRLNGDTYPDMDAAAAALRAGLKADASRPLVLAVDAEASSQRLIDAMDLARDAGALSVEISTRSRAE